MIDTILNLLLVDRIGQYENFFIDIQLDSHSLLWEWVLHLCFLQPKKKKWIIPKLFFPWLAQGYKYGLKS